MMESGTDIVYFIKKKYIYTVHHNKFSSFYYVFHKYLFLFWLYLDSVLVNLMGLVDLAETSELHWPLVLSTGGETS